MTEYEGASEYLIKKLLDHAMGKAAYTAPADVYVALYDGYPLSGGAELDTVTDVDYARAKMEDTDWDSATYLEPLGSITNETAVDFGIAGSDWGVITHWAIFDDPTAGNMLYFAPLEAQRTVLTSDTVQFPIGELRCRMSQTIASP